MGDERARRENQRKLAPHRTRFCVDSQLQTQPERQDVRMRQSLLRVVELTTSDHGLVDCGDQEVQRYQDRLSMAFGGLHYPRDWRNVCTFLRRLFAWSTLLTG